VIALFPLAETIWQQQEGTLASIEEWVILTGVLVLIASCVIGAKLSRANRIARATHDLVQQMAAEQLKANEWLEKIAARTGRIAPAVENVQRSTSNIQRPTEEKKAEPDVYKL
jgi:hypothetical protein